MLFLEYLIYAAGALFLLFFVYYAFLAAVAILPGKKALCAAFGRRRYTILIPAHNEEKVIEETLDSIKRISYPKELLRVVVIADNCSDRTAELARGSGFTCLERNDAANPGKGQALEWAFTQLLEDGFADAFVIIDADTLVDPAILEKMDSYISSGARVVQAYYDVLGPERSPIASLTYMGYAISRNLKYAGRSRLGFSVNLLGNGMCFTREVIVRFGWKAFSITEDLEYQLQLLVNGYKVAFAPDIKVYSEMPSSMKSYCRQRSRWDGGKYKLRNRYVPLLFSKFLREGKLMYLDAVLELVIPPYLLYAGASFILYAVYMLGFYKGPGPMFYAMTLLAGGLFLYTLIGLVMARAGFKVYLNLVYAPYFLVRRLWIAVESLFLECKAWVKTERV